MDWIASYWGWILINIILLPLVPLAGILLVRLAPAIPNAQLLSQVKDGQLNWIAFGMCAQALYELNEGRRVCELAKVIWPRGWDIMLAVVIALIVFSFLLASIGAIFITSTPRPSGITRISHYKVLFSSLLIALAASITYVFSHYAANPGCSAISKG